VTSTSHQVGVGSQKERRIRREQEKKRGQRYGPTSRKKPPWKGLNDGHATGGDDEKDTDGKRKRRRSRNTIRRAAAVGGKKATFENGEGIKKKSRKIDLVMTGMTLLGGRRQASKEGDNTFRNKDIYGNPEMVLGRKRG